MPMDAASRVLNNLALRLIEILVMSSAAHTHLLREANNKTTTEGLLNKFGFAKQGNGLWFNQDLNIVIQVISESYSGDPARLRKFKVKDYELGVAAPEDLIANRLYSAKFWKSNPQRDIEQTIALLRLFSDSIDNAYLDKLAKENDVKDILAQARKYATEL